MQDKLTIGIDISHGDDATIAIGRRQGRGLKIINIINGDEAKEIYEKLTNTKLEERNTNNVLYACDKKACNKPCHVECNHTTDISHAKSFNYKNGVYIETIPGLTVKEVRQGLDDLAKEIK